MKTRQRVGHSYAAAGRISRGKGGWALQGLGGAGHGNGDRAPEWGAAGGFGGSGSGGGGAGGKGLEIA